MFKQGTAVQARLSTREINMRTEPDQAAIEIARREYMAMHYPLYGVVSSHAEPREVDGKPPTQNASTPSQRMAPDYPA